MLGSAPGSTPSSPHLLRAPAEMRVDRLTRLTEFPAKERAFPVCIDFPGVAYPQMECQAQTSCCARDTEDSVRPTRASRWPAFLPAFPPAQRDGLDSEARSERDGVPGLPGWTAGARAAPGASAQSAPGVGRAGCSFLRRLSQQFVLLAACVLWVAMWNLGEC